MATKPTIIMSVDANRSLQRVVKHAQGEASVKKDTSVAAMLSQLHEIAGMLIEEVATTDAPAATRLAMARDMAKLIPLLAKAEKSVHKRVNNKDIEDMTDQELRRALKSVKTRKSG